MVNSLGPTYRTAPPHQPKRHVMPDEHMLRLRPDAAGIAAAAAILRDGGLVSFPTETVYGLGADACNDRAVAGIYAAKGRPSFNPLIVHVPSLDAAQDYCDFNSHANILAAAFWPGALTLVLPLRAGEGVSKLCDRMVGYGCGARAGSFRGARFACGFCRSGCGTFGQSVGTG